MHTGGKVLPKVEFFVLSFLLEFYFFSAGGVKKSLGIPAMDIPFPEQGGASSNEILVRYMFKGVRYSEV